MKKIFFLITLINGLFAISPLEISQKVKQSSDGFKSSKSVMKMVLIDQANNKSQRVMHSIALEAKSDNKENGDKSLIEFKTPLDVKGTKFLSHEKIKKSDNQWLYLPALKRIKRIASQSKNGSFMGSEFSYEDISSREPSKYTYARDLKKDILDEKEVYIYERYPKDKSSAYSKQILYVDSKEFITYKGEFFDKRGELLKTLTYSGYKKYGNTYRVRKMKMFNHQNMKSTIIEYIEDEINLNLNEKLFSKRYLKD